MEMPLVSCIMPTANRRRFVPQAIRYFLRQDYPNKELVIVDDGADSVSDLVPADPQVRYVRLTGRRTLGAKRNASVEECRGDLILHWDDDDWMASWRIRYQLDALLAEGAEVCGLRRMLFYDLTAGGAWLYDYGAHQSRPWLAGGSLLYTRSFWRRAPFADIQVASDTRFVWNQNLEHAVVLPNHEFYMAMIHAGNTSLKDCSGACWTRWNGEAERLLGEDWEFYRSWGRVRTAPRPPEYSILMVVHNTREMTQMATQRTLRHCRGHDARVVVVDNASNDGAEVWLKMLAARGDIELIEADSNLGHGPALELARRHTRSPYLVTLDSDAFPLCDDWLSRLRARIQGDVKVAGIRHHRDYIHPSCLMLARQTLDDMGLSFLNEKDRLSQLDVAERISCDIKRRGWRIAGLERTAEQRRGSASEPVYLGAEYEGIVHHQWYTTRAATANGGPVDDVPPGAIERSLEELIGSYHREPRELCVVVGVRARPDEPDRVRNAIACLQALNLQDLERWRYRIVVVEQDSAPRLEAAMAPLADRYVFALNPGPYNRGWAFNIGAQMAAATVALCLIDADLLVPAGFLHAGLAAFASGCRALKPYTEVIYLDAQSTVRAIAARLAGNGQAFPPAGGGGPVYPGANGGCTWVEPRLYEQIFGHDERFRGWGREDREFYARLARFTPVQGSPGRLIHLDHCRPEMEDRWAMANTELADQLETGRASPWAGPMGNPQRYAGDAAPEPTVHDWEHWSEWTAERIERIASDERRLAAPASARWPFAEVIAHLGDSLLDLGCGPGALWLRLGCHQPRLRWVGIDIAAPMLAAARRLFPGVPVCRADAGTLPFASGSVDVAVVRHVLEHLPDGLMERTLSEAVRVARRAVAVDFYRPPEQGPRVRRRVGEHFLETRWSVADIEGPITRAGWRQDARFHIGAGGDEVWLLAPAAAVAAANPRLGISIIMPTYRRCHTLFRTLQTIRAQSYQDWELILVDNSGDGGYWFADPRIRVFRHVDRASASYARNCGLQHARGRLVCYFDDDDDMFPGYLERFAATFESCPQAKMVRCGMIVSDGRVNFSYATPECCLRREYAIPAWSCERPSQDQAYFQAIVEGQGWSEEKGDIVVLREALCRANTDLHGGLRSGRL